MFKGWWIVGTHFSAQLFATGFFQYSFLLLVEPVINEFSTDATTVNYLPAAAGLLGLVIAPIAGPLVDRWSAKGLMIIGTISLVLGLVGLSLCQTILQFVVVGAVFISLAMNLVGPMTGSAVVSRWFTARRGRALGIAAIGTSVGGMLMPAGLGIAIETIGWREGLQIIALLTAVTVLPLLFFRFWDHPSDCGLEPEPSSSGESAGPGSNEVRPSTTREILVRPTFWFFTLSLGLFLAVYSATLNNFGKFGSDLGLEVAEIATLVSVLAMAGILGKLSFGYLADRISLKVGLIAAIAATGVALVLFASQPDYWVLLLAMVVMGFASGGILPVWNALVAVIFGVQNFGRAMGLMAPGIAILVAPSYPIFGAVRDATGSYVPIFQGALVVLAISVVLVLQIRVEGPESGS
jgi:MFS family permease